MQTPAATVLAWESNSIAEPNIASNPKWLVTVPCTLRVQYPAVCLRVSTAVAPARARAPPPPVSTSAGAAVRGQVMSLMSRTGTESVLTNASNASLSPRAVEHAGRAFVVFDELE